MGAAASGPADANAYRSLLRSGRVPTKASLTYTGMFSERLFDSGPPESSKTLTATAARFGANQALPADMSHDSMWAIYNPGPGVEYLGIFLKSKYDGFADRPPRTTPIDLVVALDVSGSMMSPLQEPKTEEDLFTLPSKLQVAQRCLTSLLDALTCPGDRLGIVTFHEDAKEILPLTPTVTAAGDSSSRKDIEERIQGISSGGGTRLMSGLDACSVMLTDAAADVAEAAEAAGASSSSEEEGFSGRQRRILFFTDMLDAAEEGDEGGPAAVIAQTAVNARRDIFTTFFGVGVDFDAALAAQVTDTRGARYHCLFDEKEFQASVQAEFDLMFFPVAFDVDIFVSTHAADAADEDGSGSGDDGKLGSSAGQDDDPGKVADTEGQDAPSSASSPPSIVVDSVIGSSVGGAAGQALSKRSAAWNHLTHPLFPPRFRRKTVLPVLQVVFRLGGKYSRTRAKGTGWFPAPALTAILSFLAPPTNAIAHVGTVFPSAVRTSGYPVGQEMVEGGLIIVKTTHTELAAKGLLAMPPTPASAPEYQRLPLYVDLAYTDMSGQRHSERILVPEAERRVKTDAEYKVVYAGAAAEAAAAAADGNRNPAGAGKELPAIDGHGPKKEDRDEQEDDEGKEGESAADRGGAAAGGAVDGQEKGEAGASVAAASPPSALRGLLHGLLLKEYVEAVHKYIDSAGDVAMIRDVPVAAKHEVGNAKTCWGLRAEGLVDKAGARFREDEALLVQLSDGAGFGAGFGAAMHGGGMMGAGQQQRPGGGCALQ